MFTHNIHTLDEVMPVEIKLTTILNLKSKDIGKGFVKTVRLKERDDDTIVSYCENENKFHQRYFSMNESNDTDNDGTLNFEEVKALLKF